MSPNLGFGCIDGKSVFFADTGFRAITECVMCGTNVYRVCKSDHVYETNKFSTRARSIRERWDKKIKLFKEQDRKNAHKYVTITALHSRQSRDQTELQLFRQRSTNCSINSSEIDMFCRFPNKAFLWVILLNHYVQQNLWGCHFRWKSFLNCMFWTSVKQ